MGTIYIITGKGGVGKTSVAAAHAVRSASEGKKTLFVSTDMAHNIGDIFQISAGGHIQEVNPCLSVLEMDPFLLMREEYPHINKAIANLAGSMGLALGHIGDSYMIPGMENLFSLLKIRDLYNEGRYDRIIVDCAPTGETLSLLKLPELLSWYVERFSPVGRALTRVLTPYAKIRYRMELPDESAMKEMGYIYEKLIRLQDLLKDPDITRVRLVCIPERMVVEETRRSYMYLNLYRYPVDSVFINRILPEKTGSDFMDKWKEHQAAYISELESMFTELAIDRIPWYPMEIRGMKAVEMLTEEVMKDENFFDRPVKTANEIYTKIEGGYSLTILVPGAAPEDVEVFPREWDVDIRVNNFMRSIPLPGVLRGAKVTDVRVENGVLTICYAVNE